MEPDSREYVEDIIDGVSIDETENAQPDREKIKKTVLNDIQRANNFYTEKVEPTLRLRHQIYEADREYYKQRFKNTAGQSDFVSFDFWSLVQWAIPMVMNSFFGGDDAVVIVGRNAEDVHRAEVFKELVNFQIMTQNKGFLLLWDWFTDAFQYNLGAVKVWWDRVEDWGQEHFEYADITRLQMLQADEWCQIDYMSEPDFLGNCQVIYHIGRLKSNKPIIESIRVTDLRWSPEANSLEEANFVAHRQVVTADHLRKQAQSGIYDTMAVERAISNSGSNGVIYNAFETELNDELDLNSRDEDSARSLYELYECYVKIDINGDGLLEDALISVVGDELLRVEENPYGRVPIFTLSPIRDPFKVLANLSLSEIVGEIQSIKTALMRQLLINTVNLNNLRWFINPEGVDLKDIMENRQYIKTRSGDPRNTVLPFPQSSLAPWTMNLFENFEGLLEQWTGRTRYNQGTDSTSLNKTATGISLLQQASEQRIDYIVRVFAETGVGELLRFLVELNQRYIDQPQVIRLKNEMLQITPDDLKGEFDIDVNTEAGVGKKKQTIQNLQFFLSMIAPTGMQIGAVTPGEWAKAAQKLLQESGIRDPQSYVLDPEVVKQQFYAQMIQQMMLQQAQEQQALQAQEAQTQAQQAQQQKQILQEAARGRNDGLRAARIAAAGGLRSNGQSGTGLLG